MPKLCGTDSFYGGGMVTGQPIGTMIGSRMINMRKPASSSAP